MGDQYKQHYHMRLAVHLADDCSSARRKADGREWQAGGRGAAPSPDHPPTLMVVNASTAQLSGVQATEPPQLAQPARSPLT